VSKLLESDIDSKNLMNILRAKKSNAENLFIEKILISNGGMDKKYLSGLLKLESVEKIIETVKAKFGLQQALEKFKEDNSLIHFELGLEKLKLSKGLSVLRRSILSIGTIMGFVYLKEQEISNIKKILRAKEFNIEKEETEKMLLFI
ncbi:MAG: V-type ATPase subunit, partial [Candidatus Diapherotrites archaeon]|nr:V-type ATPase subunit [Candidatus Diapherotrites archaeon]